MDHAAIEAELRGWNLVIVHVQHPGGLRAASREAGARLLERLAARVRAYSPSVPVTSRLLAGRPRSVSPWPRRVRGCELVMLHAARNAVPAGRAETLDGVLVHHRTVDDDPSPALIEFSNRAAAVVVGRRGIGVDPVALFGSVNRAMVQHAYCPVFLIG